MLLFSFSNCNVAGFGNTSCNYVVVLFFKLGADLVEPTKSPKERYLDSIGPTCGAIVASEDNAEHEEAPSQRHRAMTSVLFESNSKVS